MSQHDKDCHGNGEMNLVGPYVENGVVHFHVHTPGGCVHVQIGAEDASKFGFGMVLASYTIQQKNENRARAVVSEMMKKHGFKTS